MCVCGEEKRKKREIKIKKPSLIGTRRQRRACWRIKNKSKEGKGKGKKSGDQAKCATAKRNTLIALDCCSCSSCGSTAQGVIKRERKKERMKKKQKRWRKKVEKYFQSWQIRERREGLVLKDKVPLARTWLLAKPTSFRLSECGKRSTFWWIT